MSKPPRGGARPRRVPTPEPVESLPRPNSPDFVYMSGGDEVVIGSRSKPTPAYRVAWSDGVVHDCYPSDGVELTLDDVIAHDLQYFHTEPDAPRGWQDHVVWKGWRAVAVLTCMAGGVVEVRIMEGRRRETRYYEPAPKWEG